MFSVVSTLVVPHGLRDDLAGDTLVVRQRRVRATERQPVRPRYFERRTGRKHPSPQHVVRCNGFARPRRENQRIVGSPRVPLSRRPAAATRSVIAELAGRPPRSLACRRCLRRRPHVRSGTDRPPSNASSEARTIHPTKRRIARVLMARRTDRAKRGNRQPQSARSDSPERSARSATAAVDDGPCYSPRWTG